MHRKSFLAFRIRGLEALTEAEDLEWLFRIKIPGILCSQHFAKMSIQHCLAVLLLLFLEKCEMGKKIFQERRVIKFPSNSY